MNEKVYITTTHSTHTQTHTHKWATPAATTTKAAPSVGHVIAQDVCVAVKALWTPSPVTVAAVASVATTQPKACHAAASAFAEHVFSMGKWVRVCVCDGEQYVLVNARVCVLCGSNQHTDRSQC